MKMKVIVGVLIFLIVINLATIGTYIYYRMARPPEKPLMRGEFPFRGQPGGHPMAQLNENQRTKLMALTRGFEEETKDHRQRIHKLEDQLFRLLQTNPVQQDKVDTILKTIAEVQLAIGRMAAQKLIEAKSFLTAEQQKGLYDGILRTRLAEGGPPLEEKGPPGPMNFPPPPGDSNRPPEPPHD